MKNEEHSDPTFGRLEWNEQYEWYSTQVRLTSGQEVSISMPTDVPAAIEHIRRVYEYIQDHEISIRELAANCLLELHNEAWNEGKKIDNHEFINRMELEAITFYEDGSSELYYKDGDLFWGHCILIALDNFGHFQEASIAG